MHVPAQFTAFLTESTILCTWAASTSPIQATKWAVDNGLWPMDCGQWRFHSGDHEEGHFYVKAGDRKTKVS